MSTRRRSACVIAAARARRWTPRVTSRPVSTLDTQARALAPSAGPRAIATVSASAERAARAEPASVGLAVALEQLRALANERGSSVAEEACQRALALHPLEPELHSLHAVLLLDLRREREAEAALRKVLYLDGDLPMAHFLFGVVAARRGDRSLARQAYLRCQEACLRQPSDAIAKLGDRISHLDLWDAARAAARSLLVEHTCHD